MSDSKVSQSPMGASAGRRGPFPGRPGGPPGAMLPGERARDFKGTFKKLLAMIARYKVLLIFALLFALGSTVFNVVGPKVLSLATTELFSGAQAKIAGTGTINFGIIGQILLATFAIYVASSLCSFVQSWLMTSLSQRLCYDLRKSIAEKFDRLPMAYFESTPTGDVLSRITNDVDTLGQSFNQSITQLITSAVTVIGVFCMMLYINVIMALITLVIVPVTVLLVFLIVSRSQKYFIAQQETLGLVNAHVEETFSGQAVVRAFNHQQSDAERFAYRNDVLYESAWKSQFFSGLMPPIMNFVGNIGYVAVAISGSLFASAGIITVGDIQAFIQYVKNFTQPISQLSQVSNMLQLTAAAAERIFDFLAQEEEIKDRPSEESIIEKTLVSVKDSVDILGANDRESFAAGKVEALSEKRISGSVEFDHVVFGYDPKKPIIHDFSAFVAGGSTVALVGPTGAGKTTMVKLLMRFYDCDSGCIRIDGRDIMHMSREEVRRHFAMVLQDAWLFGGTVAENISYGRQDASFEEIQAAAKAAFADRFIQTLDKGYDTVIKDDASNISQGQRQLLTIARAICADRPMLILDEATSSVDTRTEQRIQAAFNNLMQGRTNFVIAHRLSTIKNADLILAMRDGDIVEQGTHAQLLALGGFYADLYQAQFAH